MHRLSCLAFFCNTANISHLSFPLSEGWFEFCKYSTRFTQGAHHKKGTILTCSVSNTVHVFLLPKYILACSLGNASELNESVTVQKGNRKKKSRFTLARLSVETWRHWTAACTGSCLVWHTGCFLLPVSLLRTNVFAWACRTATIGISSHAAVCTQG